MCIGHSSKWRALPRALLWLFYSCQSKLSIPFSAIWANQPIHSFLVGCLNPCLQGTSVQFGSPQPSKSNLFFKFTFCNGWIPWCYWRFEFKYAAWVPLDANTFVVFWSSKSSLIINLFSPCHKIMYIMGFQTLAYI